MGGNGPGGVANDSFDLDFDSDTVEEANADEASAEVYEGERDGAGRRCGKGTLTFPNGIYEGTFLNDRFHGEGVLKLTNGNVYIGEFEGGRYNGKGKMVYYNGKTFVGSLRQGVPDGYGEEVCEEYTFKGDWFNGTRCGYGQITYSGNHEKAGWSYVGDWSGDRQTRGVLTSPDNTLYEGAFRKGGLHGCVDVQRGSKSWKEVYKDGVLLHSTVPKVVPEQDRQRSYECS
ncbi:Protein ACCUMULATION AND REPLICATION OF CHLOROPLASTS 3 [Diplonema papillatum]|nr:Protein ACCUMULATION AND REPLICATION OF CHLOROPLASTS 3 [Diplonema papillatum]